MRRVIRFIVNHFVFPRMREDLLKKWLSWNAGLKINQRSVCSVSLKIIKAFSFSLCVVVVCFATKSIFVP